MSIELETLKRMIQTGGECHASIWLYSGTGEWYEWDFCNSKPGHDGSHRIWSDRDSEFWAEWEDGGRAVSRQVALDVQRLEPSPWTVDELAVYLEACRY
jgi:hypothetical protein